MNISQRRILEELKKIRKKSNKTQEEVAEYLGITKQAYFRYEKGSRRISLDTLIKLTEYFNLSSDYFFNKAYSVTYSDPNNYITLSKYYYELKDKYDFLVERVLRLKEDTINDKDFILNEIKLASDELIYLKSEIKSSLIKIETLTNKEKAKYK